MTGYYYRLEVWFMDGFQHYEPLRVQMVTLGDFCFITYHLLSAKSTFAYFYRNS